MIFLIIYGNLLWRKRKQQNKLWVIFFYYPNCGGRINEEIWK